MSPSLGFSLAICVRKLKSKSTLEVKSPELKWWLHWSLETLGLWTFCSTIYRLSFWFHSPVWLLELQPSHACSKQQQEGRKKGMKSCSCPLKTASQNVMAWPPLALRKFEKIIFLYSLWLCACMCAKWFQSCPTLCDPMDYSLSDLLSMGFSRQEYWSGLPCPPLGDLLNSGIKSTSLESPALEGRFFMTRTIWAVQPLAICPAKN